MKKSILFFLLSVVSFSLYSQSWTPINGRQRFVSGLGIPVRDTITNTFADSAQILFRPYDSTLYYRFKGYWRMVGVGNTTAWNNQIYDTTLSDIGLTYLMGYSLPDKKWSYYRKDSVLSWLGISGGGGGVSSVYGTANRISVTGGDTIDIASNYAGQSSINTLGTVTTGIWNATPISDAYISSASTWNGKQTSYTNLTSIGSLSNGTGVLYNNGSGTFSYTTTPTLTGTNFNGIPYSAMTGTVPTWNQNTTGTAASLSAILSPSLGGSGVNNSGTLTWGAGGTLGSNAYTSTAYLPASTPLVSSFSGGTTGLTPNTATSGAVTLGGVLSVANGGTGQTTLAGVQSWMGLGSNAYTSTAYLPLTGGTLTGNLSGTSATFSSTVTASAFYNSSDRRLKNILSKNGDMVTFKWKDGRDNLIHYGYIAQSVRKQMPNQVLKDKNGYLSVNYTEVHTKKINDLENEVAELKKELIELKEMIKSLQK